MFFFLESISMARWSNTQWSPSCSCNFQSKIKMSNSQSFIKLFRRRKTNWKCTMFVEKVSRSLDGLPLKTPGETVKLLIHFLNYSSLKVKIRWTKTKGNLNQTEFCLLPWPLSVVCSCSTVVQQNDQIALEDEDVATNLFY